MGLDSYIFSIEKDGNTFDKYVETENYFRFYKEKKLSPPAIKLEKFNELLKRFNEKGSIFSEEMYWRKAWDIHKWFVNAAQDGVDDCEMHRPLTREDIVNFRKFVKEKCKNTSEECRVVEAYRYNDDGTTTLIPCDGVEVEYGDGKKKRISNEIPIIFNENYDDWDMMHYEDALEWCNDTLAEFDFDNKYLVYVSSW